MGAYVVRRLFSGLLLVFLLTFLAFAVYELIPVDPACLKIDCGPGNHSTPADFAAADHQLGVDRPLPYQYARFVWRFVRHGSFGNAWIGDAPVMHTIAQAIPVTGFIVLGGLLVLMLLAVPLGCYAALRPRSPADRGLLAFGVLGLAIHPFVLAIGIKELFGYLHVPGEGYCPLASSAEGCGNVAQWADHLVLPWFCFALFFLPLYLRMIRVRMIETLSEQYVVTARAKGASERRVVMHHVLRNAMPPLLPMVAADAGTALTAAIYIEVVFGMPGLGELAVRSLSGQAGGYDRPVVVGIVAIVGFTVVMLNVLADIGRAALDPRVRLRGGTGFLRMPRVLSASPLARVPKPVYAAVGLAALGAGCFYIYTYPNPPSSIFLTPPVRTKMINASSHIYIAPPPGSTGVGYFLVKVTRLDLGKSGWKVHFSITNQSKNEMSPLFGRFGPSFSLGYNYKDGGFTAHRDVGADEFIPGPITSLKPGETWRGVMGGLEDVPKGVQFDVTLGQFTQTATQGNSTYVSVPGGLAP